MNACCFFNVTTEFLDLVCKCIFKSGKSFKILLGEKKLPCLRSRSSYHVSDARVHVENVRIINGTIMKSEMREISMINDSKQICADEILKSIVLIGALTK